ncbi:MAG: nicotinate phosphoribosyltransferase [Acidobacteria bacterium RBG_13_68_16]|nr:MAG: nicotinate phosphoribosyltransferase [Acidobacteria bacterium RBG_13_68_16]
MRTPDPLLLCEDELGLVTDLYQLTMFAAYRESRRGVRGCFELWFRDLPPQRNFLMAAGLEPALAYLLALRFAPEQIAALGKLEVFQGVDEGFFTDLANLRFNGDVWGMREGTIVFAGEPVLRVEAPIEQSQLVETYLLAAISFSTLVASKAARVRIAAGARRVVDFGSRRAHGPQAACWAARASFLAGVDGTSNVWASCRLGVPPSGTMAHSFVLSFSGEQEAFKAYSKTFPGRTVLLVDTFDTLAAVERASRDKELGFVAIRLDSGDIVELARASRAVLDRYERKDVHIVASGDLDETRIAEIVAAGAPVDAFGVGTRMVTSADAPTLQAVYKLVAVEEPGKPARGVEKRSAGKRTAPGTKQVWRRRGPGGTMIEDLVATVTDAPPQGPWEPLLEPWIRGGRLCREVPTLQESREYARGQLASLPEGLRGLAGARAFPVRLAPALRGSSEVDV